MFHVKELSYAGPVIPNDSPEVESEKETPILSNIRFGELAVGDKFVFAGNWLVKTGEYAAESDKKRDKINYLFFKKNIVKYKSEKEEYSEEWALNDGWHHLAKSVFGNKMSYYVDGEKVEDDPLSHKDGSTQPTNFVESKTDEMSKSTNKFLKKLEDAGIRSSFNRGKYDLFDEFDGIKHLVASEKKPVCQIIITQDKKGNSVEVADGDYRSISPLDVDLSQSWSTPISLKNHELILSHYEGQLMLYRVNKNKSAYIVWRRPFDGWGGVHQCTISIKDIEL